MCGMRRTITESEEIPFNTDFSKLLKYALENSYSVHFTSDMIITVYNSDGRRVKKLDFSDLYYPKSLLSQIKKGNKDEETERLLDDTITSSTAALEPIK